MNSITEKKVRFEWLDIIKAICIISIVVFHIGYKSQIPYLNKLWNYLDKISGLYKVTIFYCVAGITLNNEKLKNIVSFLTHKFKKLYLKIIIIALIAVFLHNIFINIGFYKVGFSYSGKVMKIYNIKDFAVNTVTTLLLGNREVILGACWFVYSLIICFIMIALIELIINKLSFIKNKRECRLFVTFLLMCVSIFVSNCFKITIPRFSNSLVGLFLLDFTNYIFNIKKLELFNPYLLISCLIITIIAPFFGQIEMNGNIITSPYFLIIVVLSVLYLLIFISKKIEKIKRLNFLNYIGKNSFSIMAFHFIGFKLGGGILNLFGLNTDIGLLVPEAGNLLWVIYYMFFGISVSLIISYLLKKFLKFEL